MLLRRAIPHNSVVPRALRMAMGDLHPAIASSAKINFAGYIGSIGSKSTHVNITNE